MENNRVLQKPVTILREEFINNLTDLINDSDLPMFVLEPIFKDMHSKIKAAERQQLENDKKRYQEMLDEMAENIKE